MSTTNPPDDVILNSEGMHLQMSAVDPTPQEFFLFKDKIVPEKVYEYYKGNSVNTFIYNKAYHVGKKDICKCIPSELRMTSSGGLVVDMS